VALRQETDRTVAKFFSGDEAHFRADTDLLGNWVLKGALALVDATSPRPGEKCTCYSTVCLETGDVEETEVVGTCTAATRSSLPR
jgi:hypothetical protein